MSVLEKIFFPIIWAFQHVLEFFYYISGSYGLAIIGLSILVGFVTSPLAALGRKAELRHKKIIDAMNPEILVAKEKFKGEKQFHAIDKIYQKHNYHPIKSISAISGFALQLPFLISSLILLINYPPLSGEKFLFIGDLAKPDGMLYLGLFTLNILPIIMTIIALLEAKIKVEMDDASKFRFYLVSVGLLILIYPLPVAVVLYWTTNNLSSFIRTWIRQSKN